MAVIHPEDARGVALEWFGLLAGPGAWLLQFIVNYALVRWECINHSTTMLHIVSAFFLLVVVAGGITSLNILKRTRKDSASGEETTARPHFMAMLGVFTSGLYALAIIMQAVASFVWSPCLR